MAFKYFNQNNYSNVPYPSPTLPKATVATGGCGVVCASIITSNLLNTVIDPIAMAKYVINNKARVVGGTDMNILARALCKDYDLSYKITNNEDELVEHLKNGGMAIANVGGNREGYIGVFSNGGHYIVVAGLVGNKAIILDPQLYSGKFNKDGRRGKVSVTGNECICNIDILAKDTSNRNPAYWLFERRMKEMPEWMKKIMADAKSIGLITSDHNPEEPAKKWFVLAVVLGAIKYIKGGKL